MLDSHVDAVPISCRHQRAQVFERRFDSRWSCKVDVQSTIVAIIGTALHRVVEIENVVTAAGNGRIDIKQTTCIFSGRMFNPSCNTRKHSSLYELSSMHSLIYSSGFIPLFPERMRTESGTAL